MKRSRAREEVLAFLRERGHCKRQELAEHLGLSWEHATQILAFLRTKGLVTREGWGVWAAVTSEVTRITVEEAIASTPRRIQGLQAATGLKRMEVIRRANRLESQGLAVRVGPYIVAPFKIEGTSCPRGFTRSHGDCIEAYVDAHDGTTQNHPCLGCIVGCARRLAFALGRRPTFDQIEESYTENMR